MELQEAICRLAMNAALAKARFALSTGHVDALAMLYEIPDEQLHQLRAAYFTAFVRAKQIRSAQVIDISDFRRKEPVKLLTLETKETAP